MRAIIRNTQNRSLGQFGLSEADVEHLIQGLAHADVQSRRAVCGALRELGEAAVPALERALQRGDAVVRQAAGDLLRRPSTTALSCGLR